MKLLKSKTMTYKKGAIAAVIAMSISAFTHAGVTFTELPVSTWGGHIAVNDQGTVAFSGDYSLYSWNSATGLMQLGDVSWGRVAVPNISIDGNTIAFNLGLSGDTVLYKNAALETIPRTTIDLGIYGFNGSLSPNGDYLLGSKMGDPARYNVHTGQLNVFSELDDPSTYTNFTVLKAESLSGEQKLLISAGDIIPNTFYQHANNEPVEVDLHVSHRSLTLNGQHVLGLSFSCTQFSEGGVSMCAALWNASNQTVTELGAFSPTDVNRDGSLVVGHGWSDQPGAKVWDSINGTRNLTDVLQQHGVNLTGWSDFKNLAVSPDGNYIAGYALNPAGERKPFVVNIVPECNGF